MGCAIISWFSSTGEFMNGQRFQNYEAYFTVLNTRESIDKEWLNMLIYDHDNSLKYAQMFGKIL